MLKTLITSACLDGSKLSLQLIECLLQALNLFGLQARLLGAYGLVVRYLGQSLNGRAYRLVRLRAVLEGAVAGAAGRLDGARLVGLGLKGEDQGGGYQGPRGEEMRVALPHSQMRRH